MIVKTFQYEENVGIIFTNFCYFDLYINDGSCPAKICQRFISWYK